ncbi:hypothetical protein, conserved [Babesia bigemina]|uniref:RAP domain-containing protein n=1 Tax=Babesia bigemina TaxID=5866 RepID=A0A061DCP2_BABBI|nr:hypothetical protein, conserved [Babesia bigemina]CDR97917.1 hypothetical protein, conserved [Babesia bigemina]|eukprot:XP_012770103.1 hypothetical protein, conserved [Babesia bigemina]
MIRPAQNLIAKAFGQLAKAQYATSAGHQASFVWKMPWQQCSIFETKKDTGSPHQPRAARDEIRKQANRSPPAQSNASDHDETQYIHQIFRKQALPKWNASVYVKALQNFAYLQPQQVDKAADVVAQLVRTIAQNINGLNNYEITRIIFACSKGRLLQNTYITRSFVRLLENEVMQRLDTLYAIDLFRILHSVTHINADSAMCPVEPIYSFAEPDDMPFDPSMVKHIIGRIVDRIANLGAMDIANLTCLIAYNGMEDDKILRRLNSAIRRRLWGTKDTIKVLTPIIALAMFGDLSTDTAVGVLSRLVNAEQNCALKAMRSISTLPVYGLKNPAARENWKILQVVNNQLYPLKLLEMTLRVDYQQVYHSIDADNRAYLEQIRYLMPTLVNADDWDYVKITDTPERPNANTQQKHTDLNLVAHIYGPYVLRECDPVRKVVVQDQVAWKNMNSWQRFYVHHYHKMQQRHLEHSGFKIVCNTAD